MLNTATFNGRFTANPEIEVAKNGKGYVRFTIAVERSYKNKNNERLTDFFTCFASEVIAKIICDHFKKGDGIIVSGEMRNSKFTTKEGVEVNTNILQVKSFDFPVSRPKEKTDTIARALSDASIDDFEEILPATESDVPF